MQKGTKVYMKADDEIVILTHIFGNFFKVDDHSENCPGIVLNPLENKNAPCSFCQKQLIGLPPDSQRRKIEDEDDITRKRTYARDNEKAWEVYNKLAKKFPDYGYEKIPFNIFGLMLSFYLGLSEKDQATLLNKILKKRGEWFDESYTANVMFNSKLEDQLMLHSKLLPEVATEIQKKHMPNDTPPNGIEIQEVTFDRSIQFGLFANSDLKMHKLYGVWSGLVIESMDLPSTDKIARDYIEQNKLTFYFNSEPVTFGEITIDPTRRNNMGLIERYYSWCSRLNHKWSWHGTAKLTRIPMPSEWKDLFSNMIMTPNDLEIYLLRDVDVGEELTWDYGDEYWVDDKPYWDLSNAPASFISFVENGMPHPYWLQYLNTLKIQSDDTSLTKKQRDRAFTLASTAQDRLSVLRQNIASRIKASIVTKKIDLSKIQNIPKLPGSITDPDAVVELNEWLNDIKKVY